MIAGINKAYILPSSAVVAGGYSINGERVGLTVNADATWMEIPLQRGEGEYTCTASVSKSGKKHAHKASIEVLTISAAVEHTYRELSRTRHLLALVLNGGETVIVGIDCPARLSIEAYTADKPEDSIGFSLKFTCESRIGYERFNGKLVPGQIVEGYGLLYNWYAAADIRGFIPEVGWNVPSLADFETLADSLGSPFINFTSAAGGKLKMVSDKYWDILNVGATNEAGLGIIGAGVREDVFMAQKIICKLWERGSQSTLFFYNEYASMSLYGDIAWRGASIRVVKTIAPGDRTPKYVTDYDENNYGVVRIGNQLWSTADMRTRHFANGDAIPNETDDAEWAALTTPANCTFNNE